MMEAKPVKINIIRPSVELMAITASPEGLIELAGRTCYKSENLITEDSADAFVRRMLLSGHHSTLEHAVATLRFVCDRGVSHELVRHRLASFSQESTRYANYAGPKFDGTLTFIRPCFWGEHHPQYMLWLGSMQHAARTYTTMVETGATPQEARSVLTNSLKTEVVMTANLREWYHVITLRCAKAAHPQMREVALMALDLLAAEVPVMFGPLVGTFPPIEVKFEEVF